jgi:uncharacterized protein YndB with AHSA1/START domain
MRENKITVIIDKPVEEVFEFTTNPKNTHKWIPSIREEIAEIYPPQIGTIYKNRGEGPDWDFYRVVEFEPGKKFTLSDLEGNYFVGYTYRKIGEKRTELEYFEWVKKGELKAPFTEDILQKLKEFLEG